MICYTINIFAAAAAVEIQQKRERRKRGKKQRVGVAFGVRLVHLTRFFPLLLVLKISTSA